MKAEFPNVANTEITKENSEYYLGIPNMEFAEALASEPMMNAQAHSICLVRVKEGDDAKAIAEQIRTSVNPRKWICVGVERDDVITAVRGDLILLVVDSFAPKAFETSFLSPVSYTHLDVYKRQCPITSPKYRIKIYRACQTVLPIW